MNAGSGIRANPCAAAAVSMAGLSLKSKSAPSRAPAASMMAESMRREVSENSRSAVSAGPSSESASTVRNSRRKFVVCTATDEVRANPEQIERNMRR
jgi:type VI protein secretion system component VasF